MYTFGWRYLVLCLRTRLSKGITGLMYMKICCGGHYECGELKHQFDIYVDHMSLKIEKNERDIQF